MKTLASFLLAVNLVLQPSISRATDSSSNNMSNVGESTATVRNFAGSSASVETLRGQADAAYKKRDFITASKLYHQVIGKCDEALKTDSKQTEILVVKSKCLYQLACTNYRHNQKASAEFRALALTNSDIALQQAPKNLSALIWRADCLRECAGDELDLERRQYASPLSLQAVECYDRYLKLKPSARAYSDKAFALLIKAFCFHEFTSRIDILEEAIDNFKLAIQLGDRSARTYAELGKTQADLSSCYDYLSDDEQSKKYAVDALASFNNKALASDSTYKAYVKDDFQVVKQRVAGTYKNAKLENRINEIKKTLHGASK